MLTLSQSCVHSRWSRVFIAFAALTCGAASAFAQAPGAPQDSSRTQKPPAAPDAPPAETPKPDDAKPAVEYVLMSTSKGDIAIELDRAKAPISVENFLKYADDGFYENTIFHRVMAGFMIQGGGFTADMKEKPTGAPIKNEWENGLKNNRGTIAMARRPQADSATSQFFINVVDNPALDQPRGGAAYAVFGKVLAGMKVVDEIRFVQTGNHPPHSDVPLEPITIKSVKRTTKEDVDKLVEAEKPAPRTPASPDSPKPDSPKPDAPKPGA